MFSIPDDVAQLLPLRRIEHETPRVVSEEIAGRLVEVCSPRASGRVSVAASCVIRAQARGETCVWIQHETGGLYPPDLARAGIDLESLVILLIPDASGPDGITRATELVLRSGAIGLAVVDLVDAMPRGDAWQSRLAALARPMVSMRVEPRRQRRALGRFAIEPYVRRDKSGRAGALAAAAFVAPEGLP
jgi:hypothetical protein